MSEVSSEEEPRDIYCFEFEETIEHMALKRKGTVKKLRPYRTSKHKKLKVGREHLSPLLQKMWSRLFVTKADGRDPDQEEIRIGELLPFKLKPTQMPICGVNVKTQLKMYHCYDCCRNPSSVFCGECFQNSNHQGHRFKCSPSGTGTCDCGDDNQIHVKGFCTNHSGKPQMPVFGVNEKEEFLEVMKQIYKWFSIIYDRDGYDALWLLIHLLLYLDRLNEKSLYYNVLTAEWLGTKLDRQKTLLETQVKRPLTVLGEILELGATHYDTNMSQWTTELFLKMLSLLSFKEMLAEEYLYYYNTTMRFQASEYRNLFIQLFANEDIVRNITARTNMSLDPKNRKDDYDIIKYNNNLLFIATLNVNVAKNFYRPIVTNGGVDYCRMRYIQTNVEKGHQTIENMYKQHWGMETSYYFVARAISATFQSDHLILAEEIRNQLSMANRYTYCSNKAIIPHHRVLALHLFTYFNGDLESISLSEVMKVLKIKQKQLLDTAQAFLTAFLICLKEFALSLGNREYGKYIFDLYLTRYIADPKAGMIFTLDCLGLRVFGMLLFRMNRADVVQGVLAKIYEEDQNRMKGEMNWLESDLHDASRSMDMERQMMRRHGRDRPFDMEEEDRDRYYFHEMKFRDRGGRGEHRTFSEFLKQTEEKLTKISVVYLATWVHLVSFIFQASFLERPEVIWGNDCKLKTSAVEAAARKQMLQLFTNAHEITAQQMERIALYWFGKEFDPESILQVANFNPQRKIYTLKPGLNGTPLCKDLLHSFIDNDEYISYSSKPIQLNNKSKALRSMYLSSKMLESLFSDLLEIYKSKVTEKQITLLRYMASLLRLIGLGLEFPKLQQYKQILLNLASKYGAENQIKLIFEQSAEVLEKEEKEENEEKDKRRLEELNRKKIEKLKNIAKPNQYVKKLLKNKPVNEEDGDCILCRRSENLFYMGLYGESSFIFNTLRCNGTYPFIQCCFHKIHFECFLEISKNSEQVGCPFCRAVCNVLLPTEAGVEDEELLKKFNERLELVSVLHARKKQISNLDTYLTKSFLHAFFVNLMGRKPLNEKKIKLYRIILQILRSRYEKMSEAEKYLFQKDLPKRHQISSPPESYPLQQLIILVDELTLRALQGGQMNEESFGQMLKKCQNLPILDLKRCLELSYQIFDIRADQKFMKKLTKPKDLETKPLSEIVQLFVPPATVSELMAERIKQETICKSGHNICVCIICRWTGCADCGYAIVHSSEFHCSHCIFFNFISGGLLYVSKDKIFEVPCLYLSQKTGKVWKPSTQGKDCFLDEKTYNAMLQALTEENLAEFMSQRISQPEIPYLY